MALQAIHSHSRSCILGSVERRQGASLQVDGPIIAVNGSNDAPWLPLRPFYGFVNKKNIFFHIFNPKM